MRCLVLTSTLIFVPLTAHAHDWPQWFGPKRDAIWREDGILEKFPPGGPTVRWRQPIGPGYAGPAVVGDRVYVMDRETDKPSLKDEMARTPMAGKERVLCLDAKTGAKVWEHSYDCPYVRLSYPNGPRSTPVVENGRVYALGTMGDLLCLDANSGSVIWRRKLNRVVPPRPISGRVAALGATVRDTLPGAQNLPGHAYAAAHPVWGHAASILIDGKKLMTLAGGDGSAVVALDKNTGNEIWRALSSEEVCYCPPTIVEAGGRRQLIIWLSETLNSLNPETGESYWMHPYPEDGAPQRPAVNIAQPRLAGDILFVSSFYHGPLAVKLAKEKPAAEVAYRGKKVANPDRATTLHALMSTPAEKDGYFYGSGPQGEVQCIEAATGKRLWADRKPFGGKDALFGTVFIIRNGDRFFLFTDQGDLIIAKLSPKGYEEIDRANLIKPSQTARGREVVWCHPAFAGQRLYVRNDKEIICVELGKS